MPDRAAARCLARQSEAPSGRIQRRDSLEQCPVTKVRGGVRGGGLACEEQSSAREVPRRRKAPRFVGSRRSSRGGGESESRPIRPTVGGRLQPLHRDGMATRVLERCERGGVSANARRCHGTRALAFVRVLCSRALGLRRATPVACALLVAVDLGLREENDSERPRSLSARTRIERSKGVLARRKRCRSRRAAPGSEKRGLVPS
jgi:hypothetical protein